MPLFKSKKDKKLASSPSPKQDSGSNKKLKLIFRLNSHDAGNSIKVNDAVNEQEVTQIKSNRLKKRVSTIIEDDIAKANENSFENSSDDYDLSGLSDGLDELDGLSEDEELDHSHEIILKTKNYNPNNIGSHIYNLMGYCGLTNEENSIVSLKKLANDELKRTFSLIDSNFKIHQLPSGKNEESVISENQLSLIQNLTEKLNQLLDLHDDITKQYKLVQQNKTLYQRYGIVRHVIGKGAYGLIKIIDPNALEDDEESNLTKLELDYFKNGNILYAVKELQKKIGEKESRKKFIDRVLSEFIISSTLNSKYLVKSVDFMITLPPLNSIDSNYIQSSKFYEENLKINQVMKCTSGGNLFDYLKNLIFENKNISFNEIDCFINQISKGLWYMHQHGVAHYDLKLENILIQFDFNSFHQNHSKINLKLSDFGKSNVFRTKWDSKEHFTPFNEGPLGSEPFISPEEYCPYQFNYNNKDYSKGFSPIKKDSWALGILILVLFNIKKNYFNDDSKNYENLSDIFNEYSTSYLWTNTDVKQHHFTKNNERKYRDKVFAEYVANSCLSDYDYRTKEWLIKKAGKFKPIETLFDVDDNLENEDEKELCELRKLFIYKLLDLNPETRLTSEQLVKGDWMRSIDTCM